MELTEMNTELQQINDLKDFKKFFERFYPSVCLFARKYLNDPQQAEDIAQEAFIEYWAKREDFTDINSAKGYIYTVAKNKCLNHIKQVNTRDFLLKSSTATDECFYELILEEETYNTLYQSVNTLAPQSRNIIWLSLEGKKNQEIADALNISINTVKTLKKNAYKELRIQLKDHLFILFLFSHLLR